jgi:nitrate reductase molybdenum cofactor assembly chaperone NarJ/NarW
MKRRLDKLNRRRARVVHQAASWCLCYPDAELVERVPLLRAALAEVSVDSFDDFLDHVERTPIAQLEQGYVDVFDLSRRHALYLSYWTDGDTRRRGEVLGDFKRRYRRSGFLVDTRGELPDYLPLVLEYAAVADPVDGAELLQQYRPSLELLRLALAEDGSSYADVVAAVCATLPGVSPPDRAAVMAMAAAGPPTETVGLEPYDPRLLSMAEEPR